MAATRIDSVCLIGSEIAVAKGSLVQLWRYVARGKYELSFERRYERKIKTILSVDNALLAIDEIARWILLRNWKLEANGCLSAKAAGSRFSLLRYAVSGKVAILSYHCAGELRLAVFKKSMQKYTASIETVDLTKECDSKSFKARQYLEALAFASDDQLRFKVYMVLYSIGSIPGRLLCLELDLRREASISQWLQPPTWHLDCIPAQCCLSALKNIGVLAVSSSNVKLLDQSNGCTLATLDISKMQFPRAVHTLNESTILIASQEYNFALLRLLTKDNNSYALETEIGSHAKVAIPSSLAPLRECISLDTSTLLTRSNDGEVCIISDGRVKVGALDSLGASIVSAALCNFDGVAMVGGRRLRLIWPEATALHKVSSTPLDAAIIRSLVVCPYTNNDWLLVKTSRAGQVWTRVTADGSIAPAPTLTEESTLYLWKLGNLFIHVSPLRFRVFSLQTSPSQVVAKKLGKELFTGQERSTFLFGACGHDVMVVASARAVAAFDALSRLHTEPRRLLNLDFDISALSLSGDGKTIAIAGWDQRQITLACLNNEDELKLHPAILPDENSVRALEYLGLYLLIGLADGRVLVADVKGTIRQYAFGKEPMRLIGCDNGTVFAAGTREAIFEVSTDEIKCRRLTPTHIRRIATVPIGSDFFAWCTTDGELVVAKQSRLPGQLEAALPAAATHVVYCANANVVLVVAEELLLYDASTAHELHTVQLGAKVTAIARATPTPLTSLDCGKLTDAVAAVTITECGDCELLFCDIEARAGGGYFIEPSAAITLTSSCSLAATLTHGIALASHDGSLAVYSWWLERPEGFDAKNIWQFASYVPKKVAETKLPSGNKATAISAFGDIVAVSEDTYSVIVFRHAPNSHSIATLAVDLTPRKHTIRALAITSVGPLRLALADEEDGGKPKILELEMNEEASELVRIMSSAKSSNDDNGERLPSTALTAHTMCLARAFSFQDEINENSSPIVEILLFSPLANFVAAMDTSVVDHNSPSSSYRSRPEVKQREEEGEEEGGGLIQAEQEPYIRVVHDCGSLNHIKL